MDFVQTRILTSDLLNTLSLIIWICGIGLFCSTASNLQSESNDISINETHNSSLETHDKQICFGFISLSSTWNIEIY